MLVLFAKNILHPIYCYSRKGNDKIPRLSLPIFLYNLHTSVVSLLLYNSYFADSAFFHIISGSSNHIYSTGYFFPISITTIPGVCTAITLAFIYYPTIRSKYLDIGVLAQSYYGYKSCVVRFYRIRISPHIIRSHAFVWSTGVRHI